MGAIGPCVFGYMIAQKTVIYCSLLCRSVTTASKFSTASLRSKITDQAGGQHDSGKGHAEKEDRDKGDSGEPDHHFIAQGALANA